MRILTFPRRAKICVLINAYLRQRTAGTMQCAPDSQISMPSPARTRVHHSSESLRKCHELWLPIPSIQQYTPQIHYLTAEPRGHRMAGFNA